MRRIDKIAIGIFIMGLAVILFGLLLEGFRLLPSAWPSILFGFVCIAISVLLDGYKGSRFS